jgi:hypothetical protein
MLPRAETYIRETEDSPLLLSDRPSINSLGHVVINIAPLAPPPVSVKVIREPRQITCGPKASLVSALIISSCMLLAIGDGIRRMIMCEPDSHCMEMKNVEFISAVPSLTVFLCCALAGMCATQRDREYYSVTDNHSTLFNQNRLNPQASRNYGTANSPAPGV